MTMENPDEILHLLEEFTNQPTSIPTELNNYLFHVARTGDPIFEWPLIKSLFKQKLLNVITEFNEISQGIDIPPDPNVEPFNFDLMKNTLLERFDTFRAAPFTIQRISELIMFPRVQYKRIDKYMRALEKNIFVVSLLNPCEEEYDEAENDWKEQIKFGPDASPEYDIVDEELENVSLTEDSECQKNQEAQPEFLDKQISVDSCEENLDTKAETLLNSQDKVDVHNESETHPQLDIINNDSVVLNIRNIYNSCSN